jgi:hypothetical protein
VRRAFGVPVVTSISCVIEQIRARFGAVRQAAVA